MEPPASVPSSTASAKELLTEVVPAAKIFIFSVDVEGVEHTYGTKISWFLKVMDGYDINFSVSQGDVKIRQAARCRTNKGVYTTKPGDKCTVTFECDNSYSWFNAKTIRYRVIVVKPDEMEEEGKREQEELNRKKLEEEQKITEQAKEDERKKEGERIAALRAGLTVAVNDFQHQLQEKQVRWGEMRNQVETDMAEKLVGLEKEYRANQQRVEQEIKALVDAEHSVFRDLLIRINELPDCEVLKSQLRATFGPVPVTLSLLRQQNSLTSNAIMAIFENVKEFIAVADRETKSILKRDAEDGEKLAEGIQIAIKKNVIPHEVKVEKINKIDVMGKSADAVAAEIIMDLGKAATTGCILILQGLSGTGKGTTVEVLKAKLPRAVAWSNGNLFRALTLLATTYAEQNKVPLEKALTPPNLQSFVKMLSFGKHNGKDFDVRIKGLGLDVLVASIVNTDLKAPIVSSNIPTIARLTQGEVINFVGGALKQMADDGCSVLLEGREQTLNYIRSPHRFELVLADNSIIGKRRAAQRMAGLAGQTLQNHDNATQEEVNTALTKALHALSQELSV
jgi:hypothetical protein